ncbi:MAG TPA: malto-oligosyltrehalose synthase, partial [Candidatus Thermoplasmatota archaeon]|nr:malto-oligosyltrehalose synthase [Candidatus Thermoplasmatota archaeon]
LPPMRATYRIQVSKDLPLPRVAALVPHLERLGVSHLYLSPLLQARAGSMHGYDTTDPTRLDASRGTEADLERLAEACRSRGMGILLDIVPNHMAASSENPWWRDVLRNGRDSPYARHFDIDWEPEDDTLRGRVLLPVLDGPLEQAVEDGHVRLGVESGEPVVRVGEVGLPIRPDTLGMPAEQEADPRAALRKVRAWGTPERLHALLERQAYVLCDWREGATRGNYRRFFDIGDLVGVRVEDPAVFQDTHGLVLDWVRRGLVHALRIDHVDGLRDPKGYLERLRQAVGEAGQPELPVFVEKILAHDEPMPGWPVQGTTGYEAGAAVFAALCTPGSPEALLDEYVYATGDQQTWEQHVRAGKRSALAHRFPRELRRLAAGFTAAAGAGGATANADGVAAAVREATVSLGVYRTYADAHGWEPHDRERALAAVRHARRKPALADGLDALEGVLRRAPQDPECAKAVLDWQQLCPAVMAKGAEDRALYTHVPFLPLGDVGAEPQRVLDAQAWHAFAGSRPHGTLNATTTHDSKRSEDVRAALLAFADPPERAVEALRRWQQANAPLVGRSSAGRCPTRKQEWALYQALLGLAAVEGVPADLVPRLQEHAVKAAREAAETSGWLQGRPDHEDGLRRFVAAILHPRRNAAFLEDLRATAREVGPRAAARSLAALTLKATMRGVPDFYHGTEAPYAALVDPDNRRDIPFESLEEALRGVQAQPPADWRSTWGSPAWKLHVTHRLLHARRQALPAFAGEYVPLVCADASGQSVPALAFARRGGDDWVLVVVRTTGDPFVPPPGYVTLPEGAPRDWRDVLLDGRRVAEGGRLELRHLVGELPVAVLLAGSR